MFTIDEGVVKLGIIGPIKAAQLERILHLAVNEGKGEIQGTWSIQDNAKDTFAISYKHASNKGIRMDASRISGLTQTILREVYGDSHFYLWVDRIARTRLGNNVVNWGNMGLAPYSLFRTVLAPQWEECPLGQVHTRMWLRMEAVLSACCCGYFIQPDEDDIGTDLLNGFRAVLGPSFPGRFVGMRYTPQDALKELAISVICGNWDITGTSYEKDKVDARKWATTTTAALDGDQTFITKTIERMVMRQLFSNDLLVAGQCWKRPSEIGEQSSARGGGATILHPPLEYLEREHSEYSNGVGKTVVVMTDLGVIAASVDDCGWSLPVGHASIIVDFNEENGTGQAERTSSLRASSEMTGFLNTIHEFKQNNGTREARVLAQICLPRPVSQIPTVLKVLLFDTDKIRFTWRATGEKSEVEKTSLSVMK